MSSFIISKENLWVVKQELASGRGRILLAEPGHKSYKDNVTDVHLSLYSHPSIKEDLLYTERGQKVRKGQTWQTGWQNDRDYLLRPRRKDSDNLTVNFCRMLFDRLIVGSYEFLISFQEVSGRKPFPDEDLLAIYIPKGRKIESDFRYALKQIISRIKQEKDFLSEESVINQIINYVKEDLRTGKVFKENVYAGLDADTIIC